MYESEVMSIESEMRARVEMLEKKKDNDPLWSIESLYNGNPELSLEKFNKALTENIKRYYRMTKSMEAEEKKDKYEPVNHNMLVQKDNKLNFFKRLIGSVFSFIYRILEFIIQLIYKVCAKISEKIRKIINEKKLEDNIELAKEAEVIYKKTLINNNYHHASSAISQSKNCVGFPLNNISFQKCTDYFNKEMKFYSDVQSAFIKVADAYAKLNKDEPDNKLNYMSNKSDIEYLINLFKTDYKLKAELYDSAAFKILTNNKNIEWDDDKNDMHGTGILTEKGFQRISMLGKYKVVPFVVHRDNLKESNSAMANAYNFAIDYFIHMRLQQNSNDFYHVGHPMLHGTPDQEKISPEQIFGINTFKTENYINGIKNFKNRLDAFKKDFINYKSKMKEVIGTANKLEKKYLDAVKNNDHDSNIVNENVIMMFVNTMRSATSDLYIFQRLISRLSFAAAIQPEFYQKIKSKCIKQALRNISNHEYGKIEDINIEFK